MDEENGVDTGRPGQRVPRGDARPRNEPIEQAEERRGRQAGGAVHGHRAAPLADEADGGKPIARAESGSLGTRPVEVPRDDRVGGRERRRPWLDDGRRHLGDRRPSHVLRAEGVRRSGPRPAAKRLAQLGKADLHPLDCRVDPGARRDDHEAVGMLAVRGRQAGEVTLAIEAEERRHVVVAGCVEEACGPAQHRRRVADGAERVAHVVLAVAEGPLAVLPGLAPVDGGEADQESAGGQRAACPWRPAPNGARGRGRGSGSGAGPRGDHPHWRRAGSLRSGGGCRSRGWRAAPTGRRRAPSTR